MYSEQNKKPPQCRANDAFLRRMLGGELTGQGGCGYRRTEDRLGEAASRVACDGTRRDEGMESGCGGHSLCQGETAMPSLAMVYAPVQVWNGVLDPANALRAGSQFPDLVLPLESYSCGRGGKACR